MYLGYLGETNPCEAAQGAAYNICKEAESNPALKSTCDSLWSQAQHCEANAAAQQQVPVSSGGSSFWDSVTAFMPVIQPVAQTGLQLGLQRIGVQPAVPAYRPQPQQSGGSNTLIVVGGVALVGLVIYLALK